MRDMTPRSDRSIRNIPLPTSHRRQPQSQDERETSNTEEEDTMPLRPMHPRHSHRNKRKKWFLITAIAVVVLGSILGILLSTFFAGATITVYPRQESITVPPTLSAQLNAPVGTLGYQTMSITRNATTTVAASGSKQVSRQASGIITIYNTFSTASQRLIANTRFEAPDGKIYRIHDSVVVPGGIKNADGALTPGSINITVYADSAGAEYNRGQTRFTIPGFKGDPRYEKFYAQTNSITNGFIGTEPAVASADLLQAQAQLQQQLQTSVQSAFLSQMPESFLPIPGTLHITYSSVMQTPSTANSATLTQTANATAAIVRAGDLASALARRGLSSDTYHGEAIAFVDSTQISITATTSKNSNGTLTLQLSGSPTLVWRYDPQALLAALIGKDKSSFQTIIQSFEPAIRKAEAKVRPFWKGSFPRDANKITIVEGHE